MSHPADGGGGVVTQRDLDASLALRRRARDAAAEARECHRQLARRLSAGEASEPGRYRAEVARVRYGLPPGEESVLLGVYDSEALGPYPIVTAAFDPEELA